MSDSVNPFESPVTTVVPVKPLIAQGNLTETMVIYLKGASPWLRFVGILGFVSAGITALSGVLLFALFPLMEELWGEIPGFESSFSGALGAVFGGSMAVFCIIGGLIILFPSLFIYRFGEKIRSYLRTGTDQYLELALKNNKSLWKFLGIFTIVELAFIPLLIIAGIIIAVATALA